MFIAISVKFNLGTNNTLWSASWCFVIIVSSYISTILQMKKEKNKRTYIIAFECLSIMLIALFINLLLALFKVEGFELPLY